MISEIKPDVMDKAGEARELLLNLVKDANRAELELIMGATHDVREAVFSRRRDL